MASKQSSDQIINMIGLIRTANNILWMDILKIAFNAAPTEARKVMKQIKENDREITKWLGKL